MDKKLRTESAAYGVWAIVTGASDGIGKAVAFELAKSGSNLVLVARRRKGLTEVAKAIAAANPSVQTIVYPADLSERHQVETLANAFESKDVGLLVHAAGFGTSGEFVHSDLEDELGMLEVNCRAALVLSRRFAERFKQRGGGGIILFGSLVGFQGVANAAHYAATKAYIQVLGEGLRAEMKAHKVDVLVSAPGPVFSGFGRRAKMNITMGTQPFVVARETIRALGRKTTVRPGFLSKFLEFALKTTFSRRLRTFIMSRVMGSMTKGNKNEDN